MTDYLIFLYRYFSKFVPENTLKETLSMPESSTPGGYSETISEILRRKEENTLPIDTFVFSVNEAFVSDSVKNNSGYILFVEYGDGKYTPERDTAYIGNIAVTIAKPYTMPNNDNLSETIANNDCLNMLTKLLGMISADLNTAGDCCISEIFNFPVSVVRIDPKSFYNNTGFVAYFKNVENEP